MTIRMHLHPAPCKSTMHYPCKHAHTIRSLPPILSLKLPLFRDCSCPCISRNKMGWLHTVWDYSLGVWQTHGWTNGAHTNTQNQNSLPLKKCAMNNKICLLWGLSPGWKCKNVWDHSWDVRNESPCRLHVQNYDLSGRNTIGLKQKSTFTETHTHRSSRSSPLPVVTLNAKGGQLQTANTVWSPSADSIWKNIFVTRNACQREAAGSLYAGG